ncbi:GntR family transcriptional regulator [Bacillus sp. J14TS2]|uniref:GntR family transcriptional regulator n=1 Tax=Bacillus sp. J14TS2 TaxID=2807188 RepID=UPI001B082E75|nr:GntR family transcriptional regulator [Bacillus sp. J14TS2]GIN71847.1 GntR family transcriptional regulator [Bacillus sp. J14TS2]
MKSFYPENRLADSSLGERVMADLRMRIISKDVQEGAILSENKLSQEYNMSRSPIRDALKLLEKEGLVEQQRMGAKVIGLTEQDIDEIYDIRIIIESFVFKKLLKFETVSLNRQLNKILEMMKIAVKYEDADEFSFRDVEFHEKIITSIQHRHIEILWANLRPIMECLILLSMRHRMEENKADFKRVIHNHEWLIKAIENKDQRLVDEAFYKNFNDVHKQSDDLWSNPIFLKRASMYHE